MNTHKLAACAAILFAIINSARGQSPPQYSVVDLDTLSGVYSQAMGINNAGQVVGLDASNDGTGNRAFLYSGGTMAKLGTLGGSNRNTFASAINDVGQVVGYSVVLIPAPNPCDPNNPNYYGSNYCDPQQNPDAPDPNAPYFVERGHAFLYSGGTMSDLGALPNAAGGESSALGINNSGKIVGYSPSPFDPYYGWDPHGFLYSNGPMLDLGDLGGGRQTIAF